MRVGFIKDKILAVAPAGTEVLLSLTAESLTVRDFGPGVADDELPQLFNRFWRGEHRKDIGAGLGLAICQEIAVTHQWTLSAHKATPGLLFSLSIQSVVTQS